MFTHQLVSFLRFILVLSVLALCFCSVTLAQTWHNGDVITYSQDSWGNQTHAAGQALVANFTVVYPGGEVEIGVLGAAGFSMVFGSSGAVLAYLPASGSSTVNSKNSIIAGNTATTSGPDYFGTVVSQGNNLIGKTDASSGWIASDLTGTIATPLVPLLAPLANNGGPTQTHALLPGSPAINTGTNTGAPATDQRNIIRPQQTTTDIGAFESRGFTMLVSGGDNQSTNISTAFANPLAVSVSSSFSEPVDGGKVTFTPPLSGASSTIAGNPAIIASGTATTGTATANANSGGYSVAASATGVGSGVNFSLTNTIVHKFIVINTNDAGTGSLRQAIDDANATPNINASTPDTIWFNIAGAGPHTIAPVSALPTVTDPVIIDGYSQPGSSKNTLAVGDDAVLKIVLSVGGPLTNGLTITAGNTTLQGLVINGFSQYGIFIQTNGSNVVSGNFIGTDASGTLDLGNSSDGVFINGAPNNTVGGTTVGERNIISGNNSNGVQISSSTATGNKVTGNYIGTDATGTLDLGNTLVGVFILAAPNNAVGGTTPGERNIISGNNTNGVFIGGSPATGNKVMGNYIGTDVNGTADLGNSQNGVFIDFAPNNTVGGTTAGERNIISGNNNDGVSISGASATGNKLTGNYIGTDATGTLDLRNTIDGVYIAAPNNIIGGTTAGERNIISGNVNGVVIEGSPSTGNKVIGNYIGTDASGSADLGNHSFGVSIIAAPNNTVGGTTAGERNIISGNNSDGVRIAVSTATGNKVTGNYIGTDATGTAGLGNSGNGVSISFGPNNTVGGIDANTGNTIAFNGGVGVVVFSGTGNAIDPNSIFGNGGLGIDLGGTGITPNDLPDDGDGGANNLQNFPEMTQAQRQGNGDLSVTYSVPSSITNSAYPLRIEFFKAQDGEGKTFLGTQSYTAANAEVPVTQTFTPDAAVSGGDNVVATATDANGNTSEFSAVIVVIADPSGIISDDFNTATLKPFWTFINPSTPSTMSLVGTGTIDARLRIQIPDGASHDVWTAGNMAPRVMQNCNNGDFEVEVKFDGQMTSQYQIEGIIVEQDANRFLRFDFVKGNANTRIFVASFTGGVPTALRDFNIPQGNPAWMRVKRVGNNWIQSYSYDGTNFTVLNTMTNIVLNVTKIGPFVGNAGYPEGTAPAFDGLVDYFFSTASPIVPEDGTVAGPTITQQPANQSVQVGQMATFTIAATGTIPLSYQWLKSNVPIGGATSTSYTTPPTTLADNGATFKCVVSNSTGTVTSNAAVLTVTQPPPGSNIVSDDFNSATLNTSLWTVFNPAPVSTFSMVGTNTVDARLSVAVPAASSHDVWTPANNAPRIMQSMNNTDFEAEVKFEQPMTAGYQIEGMIVQQDPGNYLRFGFVRDFSNTRLFAASFVNGTPTVRHDINITGNIGGSPYGGGEKESNVKNAAYSSSDEIDPPIASGEYPPYIRTSDKKGDPSISDAPPATLYLRVKRLGATTWTQSYSIDGMNFIAGPSFNHTLTASSIGPYGGNAGFPASAAPAFNWLADYFFNTASPIVPEDGTTSPPVITTQPTNQTVGVGQAATFSVGATGSSPLAFLWQKNNVNIGGATNPSYTTPSTTMGDDGSTFRCIVSNSVGTVTSNAATLTVTTQPNPSGIFSDDFRTATLDPRWVITNPPPVSTFALVGSNTINARLSIAVSAASNHDVWSPANAAPRIMQPANNTDFELEVKFEQTMTAGYQIEGVLAEESPGNYVRFGFVRDPNVTRIFAASFVGNVPTIRTDVGITQSNPLHVRVNRQGNSWLQTYSNNGSTYNSVGPFTHALTVTKVGTYIGNAGFPSNTAPAFTGLIDYFFNTMFPIVPEDGVMAVKAPDQIVNLIPDKFVMNPSYPNPFNPSTTISYGLPEPASVSLVIYDVLGRTVAELAHGMQEAGYHSVVWNASNLSSGVYIARFTATDISGKVSLRKVNKLLLTK